MSSSLAERAVACLELDTVMTASLVGEYYLTFTGRWFDRIASSTDPTRYEPADLYACATLSAEVPGAVGVRILEDDELSALLSRVPVDVSIRDPRACDLLHEDSAAAATYRKLRELPGVGPTRASKLLAVKRPGLIPIRDSVVESLLDMASSATWWEPWTSAWQQPRLSNAVDTLRDQCGSHVPATVTDLRLLDVALWRLGVATEKE